MESSDIDLISALWPLQFAIALTRYLEGRAPLRVLCSPPGAATAVLASDALAASPGWLRRGGFHHVRAQAYERAGFEYERYHDVCVRLSANSSTRALYDRHWPIYTGDRVPGAPPAGAVTLESVLPAREAKLPEGEGITPNFSRARGASLVLLDALMDRYASLGVRAPNIEKPERPLFALLFLLAQAGRLSKGVAGVCTSSSAALVGNDLASIQESLGVSLDPFSNTPWLNIRVRQRWVSYVKFWVQTNEDVRLAARLAEWSDQAHRVSAVVGGVAIPGGAESTDRSDASRSAAPLAPSPSLLSSVAPLCERCGEPVRLAIKGRPRRFCSRKCRDAQNADATWRIAHPTDRGWYWSLIFEAWADDPRVIAQWSTRTGAESSMYRRQRSGRIQRGSRVVRETAP